MKKILLIADAKGWIFHRHCDEITKRLPEFCFETKFSWHQDPKTYVYSDYDLIYQLDPMGIPGLNPPKNKTILGLRNEFMYTHNKEGILRFYQEFFESRACMFHVVNKSQLLEFASINPSIPLLLVQHGVDTNCFRPINKKIINKQSPLVVGVSGNENSAGEKGFDIVKEACSRCGCPLLTTKQNLSSGHLNKEQMAEYYNKIDVYCCMSKSEGLNNCIMEAGATGVPVITTRTGAATEMIVDGVDGFIINRDVNSLTEKINFFKNNTDAVSVFGNKFMRTVRELWSWDKKIEDFRRMFNEFFKS